MNILYIGKLNEFGVKICNYLNIKNDVISMSPEKNIYEVECKTIQYNDNLDIKEVILENKIEIIIFFEHSLFFTDELISKLYDIVKEIIQFKTIIFIKECDIFRLRNNESPIIELMSKEFRNKYNLPSAIIYTSGLYGETEMPQYVKEKIKELKKRNSLTPYGAENEYCDYIYINDFCEGLNTIIEENYYEKNKNIQMKSNYPFYLKDLLENIACTKKQANIKEYEELIDNEERNFFHSSNWSPKFSFMSDLDNILKYDCEFAYKTNNLINKLFRIMFVLFLFVFSEIYVNFISVASDLQYVDLRLLMIVICSIFYGKNIGIFSASIYSIGSFIQSLLKGYKWHLLFYNVNNWIPITVYFIVAVGIGTFTEISRAKERRVFDDGT